ncbi:hypothetical protein [Nocardia sp. XZ_19_231]|uniref:hypothetical protein n=1 Tax=Nocardia sp. XZ_19_231 TaxID=2769252 RepID=UPI00188F147D|nr:hypothetical protein [Nocardia sp. XZ_19_231]
MAGDAGQARVAATATVVVLHDLGIADDMLHIMVSGEPLAVEGFSMDIYLEFVDRYAKDRLRSGLPRLIRFRMPSDYH